MTIELLCRLRFDVRGKSETFNPLLLAEIDSKLDDAAERDGYRCDKCRQTVPHDSDFCPHCGAFDDRPSGLDSCEAARLERIAANLDGFAVAEERFDAAYKSEQAKAQAAAFRRAAAIIRHQIECEA